MSKGSNRILDRYTIVDASCSIGVRPLICDANLLIAKFRVEDKLHENADFILQEDYVFLTTLSTLIETYHQVKDDYHALKALIEWLLTPDRLTLLPEDTGLSDKATEMHEKANKYRTGKARLDLVDCLLLVYAVEVAKVCGIAKPLPIATADETMMTYARSQNCNYSFWNVKEPLDLIQ